jgi:hypothetical protein
MGIEQNYQYQKHPETTGTTFTQHFPYTKDTHIFFLFFTAVAVHIVIFWVVTGCSPVGGNHVSVKHVASIFGAKAGRLRIPLGYIC